MNHCLRHYEESIAGYCRMCQQPFCTRCLVYSFGPKKPPYCVGCALHAAGVRNGVRPAAAGAVERPAPAGAEGGVAHAAPTMDRRTERAMKRAERDAQKQALRVAKKAARRRGGAPAGTAPAPVLEAARASRVPAPSQLVSQPAAWPTEP